MINFFPNVVSRSQSSKLMNFLVPIIAVILTLITGSVIFSIMGFNPVFALHTFFISPISSAYGISELLVKATPLALIAIGLAFCFKNNLYNIGAEGQLTFVIRSLEFNTSFDDAFISTPISLYSLSLIPR